MRLIRTFLILVIGVIVGVFVASYWSVNGWAIGPASATRPAAGVTPRERGAELTREAARTANAAANRLEGALSDGALTAKISSKLALDDHVNARTINVDTTASVVTLRGTVDSDAERERALQLARDTRGVTRVVDALQLKPR
jgi:hyperosmotically inducible periplasmic protein